MADVAFLPIPIAVTPAPPAASAATAPDVADPFASLLAAIGESAPALPVLPVPTVAASPAAPATDAEGDAAPAIDADAADDDDRKATAPLPSPLGEITAMLALVPPPPPATVRALPAAPPPEDPSMTLMAAAAPSPSPDTPVADTARPAQLRDDAPPSAMRRDAAAALVRALQGGGTLVDPQAGDPAQNLSLNATPTTAADPTDGVTTPALAAVAGGDPVPAPKRPAVVATRSISPTAPATAAAQAEPPPSDLPRVTRRVALANAPDAIAAPAIRTDMLADTKATAAALPDDPVARQLSLTHDGQWLDGLARDIAAAGGKDGQLRFRLDPDHLGALTVAITQSADGASVRLTASTEQARTIIADAQPRLVAEARAQGLHLREASVETGNASSAGTGAGARGGDQGALAGQLQQQQQGRRQPAPEPTRAAAIRPAPTRDAPARAADLYA